ncbi:MAG: regulatory iron-sulfur-containing complex subunit RicT [Bacteroidota bacterium]|nr:regulatory iron-sulfur-containing complex subunit RicT [Bacteroidota bacterium]
MDFKYDNKGCNMNKKGCSTKMDTKLNTFDWLCDIDEAHNECEFIEVQFKNTRKGYYRNSNGLRLEKGDVVAVEATPGHDIGTVTLTGRLVILQMKKMNVRQESAEIKRVYRKARPVDMEKYEEAKGREHETMLRSRQIADELKLNMKIGDVEYQGDGNKAIFYYIADDRVDFRQLIKVLADSFKVRIEMKQIGARQEAGRIGGIGPCGRPLCCSGWMTNFVSVATSAARYQDISLNPQKLAGQCAKLKCCLNYEVDSYVEVQKELPSREIPLETQMGTFYHFKTDIFNRLMTYSSDRNVLANLTTIHADRVFEIISQNKKGIKPENLLEEPQKKAQQKDFQDGVGEESLTRFDREKRKKINNGRDRDRDRDRDRNRGNRPNNNAQNQSQAATGERQSTGESGNQNRNNRDNQNRRGGERPNRPERPERPRNERSDRNERTDRPERNDRPERQNRPPRNQRPNRPQRPENPESSEK